MPKKALNDLVVKRLKPPASGQVDVFDLGYPGFALRVSYGGAKAWTFFYRLGNRQRRLTLGHYPATSLSEAREKWRQAKEHVARGRDPSKQDTAGDNFESVAREWLKRDQQHNRSFLEVERIVNKEMLPIWGHRSIRDVRRHDILVLIDEIADRGSTTIARRVAAYVHRLFRWSLIRGVIDSNPAAALPKPGREVKRNRVLTDDELKLVWLGAEQAGWPYGTAIQLLILTGARRAEISELQWPEVDGATLNLDGARTKNGEPHRIPLSKVAQHLLEEAPRIAGSQYVFGRPLRGGAWAQAKADFPVKIAAWRIHDLRRTASSGMNELGVEPHIVEALLGHKVPGIAATYNYAEHKAAKRAAAEAWGAHVMTLLGKRAQNVVALGQR
ncbi:MAG: tyrosine-type recombinase/integrase [Methyloceanibacter sp.]